MRASASASLAARISVNMIAARSPPRSELANRFDQPPACRKIRLAHRPRPDRVEMTLQHNRLDCEQMMPACLSRRCTQLVDAFRGQTQPPLFQIDGEQEANPGDEVAMTAGHAGTLSR